MSDESKVPEATQEMVKELHARRCLEEIQAVLKKHSCVLIPSITFVGTEQKPGLVCRYITKEKSSQIKGNNNSQKDISVPKDGEAE